MWCVPFAVWQVGFVGSVLGFLVTAVTWREEATSWSSTIAYRRSQGDVDLADAQQATADGDSLHSLETMGVLALVFLLFLAAFFAYRKKVPLDRRGGLPAIALAVVVTGVLAGVGYLLLGILLKGAIKG